jgi:hypothetical protein
MWCWEKKVYLIGGHGLNRHTLSEGEYHDLMYEYFDINPVQLEQERRTVLVDFVQWRKEQP